MIIKTIDVNGKKASIQKVSVLGQEAYAISVPFDLGDRNTVFATEKGAKITLTRYIKQFNKGGL